MVGRAAYGRPWATADIAHYLCSGQVRAEPGLAAQKAILLEHYTGMLEHFGRDAGMRLARKHLAWYSRGLTGSAGFRAGIMRLGDADLVFAAIDGFFDKLIAEGAVRGQPAPDTLDEAA